MLHLYVYTVGTKQSNDGHIPINGYEYACFSSNLEIKWLKFELEIDINYGLIMLIKYCLLFCWVDIHDYTQYKCPSADSCCLKTRPGYTTTICCFSLWCLLHVFKAQFVSHSPRFNPAAASKLNYGDVPYVVLVVIFIHLMVWSNHDLNASSCYIIIVHSFWNWCDS